MANFDIKYSTRFDRKSWSVVLNCGEPINLPDGTVLGNFQSSLYRNIEFSGDHLVIFDIGNNFEVSNEVADRIRKTWTPVSELFPDVKEFKGADFYRSPRVEIGEFAFSLWYFGKGLTGPIHREHDFFELHTQVLGTGEMQKFGENDQGTMYERVIMAPGQTHNTFFDRNRTYPWHRYAAISRSVLLAIESQYPIPKK